MPILPILGNKELVEGLLGQHPYLETHTPERLLVCWLITGAFLYDNETNYVLAPRTTLAGFAGKSPKDVRTGDILRDTKDHVLPELDWSDYWHEGQKCRAIKNTGLDKEWVHQWLTAPLKEQILVDTLQPYSNWMQEERYRSLKKEAAQVVWSNPDQQFIAETLLQCGLKQCRPEEENIRAALELALKKKDKDHALRMLRTTAAMPVEFYKPSGNGGTVRMFGSHQQYTSSNVRHKVHPDWEDVDLSSCQLRILAGRFDAPLLKRAFADDIPFWQVMADHMQVPPEQFDLAKPHLKKATYSTIYGMQPHNVEKQIREGFAEEGLTVVIPFLSQEYMQEVLNVLEYANKLATKQGGLQGAYGWMPYTPEMDRDRFLACHIQTFELAGIIPVYRYSRLAQLNPKTYYQVMLHQHDGVSVRYGPRANQKTIREQLEKRVYEHSLQFGIDMRLG